jgi:hypothetical protein
MDCCRCRDAARADGREVAAVRDVRAAALLIGAEIIRAQHLPIDQDNVDPIPRRKPILQRRFSIHASWQREDFSGEDYGLQERPDGVPIRFFRRAYLHHDNTLAISGEITQPMRS